MSHLFRYLGLLLLLVASPALAQNDSAAVLGTVRDNQGQGIAGVDVGVKNVDTGFVRLVKTAADGTYRLAALPPGRYSLAASALRYVTVVREGIILSLGAEAVIDVEMPPSGFSAEIVVTADVPVVQTTTSAIEMQINREQLDLLPLFFRDYTALLRLTPASQAFGSSFTGSRDRSNEFSLDGVDNSSDISGLQRVAVPLESIQEFQVLANNYKAEHGRASGGIISVLTRSGANAPSGSAFFAISDDAMNAQSPVREPADSRAALPHGDLRRKRRRITGTRSLALLPGL